MGRFGAIGGIAVLSALLLAVPAHAVQPIEGSWFYEGGEVLVEPTGPGTFKGTVVQPTRLSDCTHPAGQRMWEISGSGTSYSGSHIWYFSDCRENPGGESTWSVTGSGARQQLVFCTALPGSGPPGPGNPRSAPCHTLDRAKPAEDRTQACAGQAQTSQSNNQQVCLDGPAQLRTVGCLTRGNFTYRFKIKLKKRSRGGQLVNRRSRVRVVKFTLDGRRNGSDRRRPFIALVGGAGMTPGAHVLRATVSLRVPGTRRGFTRRISYRFNGCG